MKKFLFFILFFPFILKAAWLNSEPVTVTQPDGTILHCFATGDEFYNWLHDADGFTIVQHPDDGFYYFAVLDGDKLVASSLLVGEADPVAHGLRPGINLPASKRMEIRRELEQHMRLNEAGRSGGRAAGVLNNIVIYIRFSDQEEFTTDTLINYSRFNNDQPGSNSVLNYFHEVSYGKLELPSTFYPVSPDHIIRSYQDTHPRAYYMPHHPTTNPQGYQGDNQRTQREHTLLANAVTWINEHSPVPEYIDLDYNNDGYVDNVVFIIRGAPTAWSTLLWPHRWSLYTQTVYINGKRVWDFNFQLETSMNSSGVGVLCHELYHSLGAPDLYRYVDTDITPVGQWDIMAANNNPPQYMGAFMKFKYGNWIEEIPWITESGTYTINPLSEENGNVWRIPSQNSTLEYFVLEYRKKEGTFDGTLPRSGLLVYRINPSAGNGNAQGPPDEVYIFRPGGTPSVNGNLSNAVFAENYGRTAFGDGTDPYPFLQNGNFGGVYISDISMIGPTMSFKVDFPEQPQADISANAVNICVEDEITLLDVSTGLPDTWNWTIQPNTFAFVNGTNAHSENPEVKFLENGNYDVSLQVSNSFGSDQTSKQEYIKVGAITTYFEEGFESADFKRGSWLIENPDDNITWGIHPVSGNGGNWAAGIDFRTYYSIGQRDRLISKPFDLSSFTTASLSFEHAYALNQATMPHSDSLIVLYSTDCGQSWTRLVSLGEDGSGNFATHLPTIETFFPTVADDWCGNGWGSPCNSFDLSFLAGQSDIRFAFETVSFYGNPILIDNVVIEQYVGTSDEMSQPLFAVYPNPAQSMLYIQSSYNESMQSYEIVDMSGRTILYGSFNGSASLDLKKYCTPGLYIIHLRNELESQNFKIFVK